MPIDADLERLAQQFARDLITVLVQSPIDQLLQLSGQPARRTAPTPSSGPRSQRGPTPKKKEMPTSKRQEPSSKRVRRSTEDLQGLVERIVRIVHEGAGEHPDGVAVGELAKALRRDSQELTRPLHLALKDGFLKKKGEKRQTRYFPGKKSAG